MGKKKHNNKKGFTLVELLAVIIILALIMVLAIPSVLSVMNSSKKKTFSMYGQKVINNALEIFQAEELLSENNSDLISGTYDGKSAYCINIQNLGMTNTGNYKGYVIIIGTNADAQYLLWMTDGNDFYYEGVDSANIDSEHVTDGKKTTLTSPSGFSGCYSESNS